MIADFKKSFACILTDWFLKFIFHQHCARKHAFNLYSGSVQTGMRFQGLPCAVTYAWAPQPGGKPSTTCTRSNMHTTSYFSHLLYL